MGRLLYMNLTSLDGYIADRSGSFDWAEPDEDVHAAVNDILRPVGTYLYGRRVYEVMRAWADPVIDAGPAGVVRDFAQIWRAAQKIVYSRTLPEVTTARTRLERSFDPAAVRALKEHTDLEVGGAGLAAEAFGARLVDDVRLFIAPVAVGGGTPALPEARLDLDLVDERRIGRFVYVHYTVRA
ncbi:dihydrofolate reductase [Sinomonas atrocyanea]|jgi:dihydrofolate reductase|uniref:dihydrofolate reductase family protein n=1 Tax=Sinomonas atrocyanea TaxID=37927 RepID=UPI002780DAF0|nr:dihydrofolate reductase family protein [Sinomonas atrocyanea]MDP9885326.1 dihydrofolate reductase [Sinomonas atrocyanea]